MVRPLACRRHVLPPLPNARSPDQSSTPHRTNLSRFAQPLLSLLASVAPRLPPTHHDSVSELRTRAPSIWRTSVRVKHSKSSKRVAGLIDQPGVRIICSARRSEPSSCLPRCRLTPVALQFASFAASKASGGNAAHFPDSSRICKVAMSNSQPRISGW